MKKFSVLLVDDEHEIREFLSDYMKEKGYYNILEAANLFETEKILASDEVVDLVVLDLIMPDSKGLEALAAVREKFSDVKVIVLTGYPGLRDESLSVGAALHIEKPFSPQEVEGCIRDELH